MHQWSLTIYGVINFILNKCQTLRTVSPESACSYKIVPYFLGVCDSNPPYTFVNRKIALLPAPPHFHPWCPCHHPLVASDINLGVESFLTAPCPSSHIQPVIKGCQILPLNISPVLLFLCGATATTLGQATFMSFLAGGRCSVHFIEWMNK